MNAKEILKRIFDVPGIIGITLAAVYMLATMGQNKGVSFGTVIAMFAAMAVILMLICKKIANVVARKRRQKAAEEAKVARRIEQAKAQSVAYCPKCGSTSVQLRGKEEEYSVTRGIVGGLLLGPGGELLGFKDSGASQLVCMNCGSTWTVGRKIK